MLPEKDFGLPGGSDQHMSGHHHMSSSSDDVDYVVEDMDDLPAGQGVPYESALADVVSASHVDGGGAGEAFSALASATSAVIYGTHNLSRNTTATKDELELIADTQAESKARYRRKRRLLKPMAELEKLDKRIMDIGQGEEDFVSMMTAKIKEYGVRLPSIRVDYSNLTVATDAMIGSAGLPTVGNALTNMLKMLVFIKPHQENFKILDNVKGVLLPGRATLLLGPPSSGKTTFLKVLAGHYKHSKALQITGDLKYNGQAQSAFVVERTAGFISQNDVHIPSLTVMETLEFAYQCQNGTGENGFYLPRELAKAYERTKAARSSADVESGELEGPQRTKSVAEREKMTDEQFLKLMHDAVNSGSKTLSIMRAFGIAHTKNTLVGDPMLRGVSGGERKRVTTAEIVVGPKRLLLADEISTGLDSATLHSIIGLLARICRGMQLTCVISLLQPPPEVFHLFDDLILMADNHIVYHGPIGDVIPFFTSLGFEVPARKDIPSFLQEVTTPSGQLEFSSAKLRQACNIPDSALGHRVEAHREFLVPIDTMVAAFWSSPRGVEMQALLDKPMDPALGHPQALVKEAYALRPFEAFWIVQQRQVLQILKDSALIKGRVIQCVVLGLIIGSLFFRMSVTVANSRTFFGALFMHVMFIAMGQMPSLATTVATKAVWFKYRDSKFYHCSTHAFACTFASIPTALLDTAVYTIIVYFMNGFYSGAGYYFTFYFINVTMAVCCASLFRLVGHISPDGVTANAFGGLLLLVLIVMSGFTIVRGSIPKWWIWAYWISPFAWSLRGVIINEMTSPNWTFYATPESTETVGVESLLSFDFYTQRFWIWAGIGYCWAMTVVLTLFSAVALQYLSGTARVARVADKEELAKAREDAVQRRAASGALPPMETAASALLPAPSNTPVTIMSGGGSGSIGLQRSASQQLRRRSIPVTAAQVLGPSRAVSEAPPPTTSSSIPFEPISLVFLNLKYFVPNPSYTGRVSKKAARKEVEMVLNGREADKADVRLDLDRGGGAAGLPPKAAEVLEEVPEQLELLKGITGFAEPRMLMALMGGSGAGKTTLMDCIAGRKTVGRIEGDIFINGHPKDQRTWSRVCGYVEQMDIHTPAMTVVEALQFSARLRLPASVSNAQAKLYVEEVMHIVDMSDNQFDLTGIPGQTGLSVEQRKRLTIAVELVANPSVVFMDEPTSGLDARAAAVVIRAVRNVARNNRSVMVTIHQPSIEIFEAFDFLLLLQRGGRTTYFGPLGHHSCNLVAYLEAVPGCSKVPHGANPATWMLEVTGGAAAVAAKAVQADWPALYAGSEKAAENVRYAQDLVQRLAATMQPLQVSGQYAANLRVQYTQLMNKFRAAYWRTPSYNFTRMLVTVLVALFYGSVYFRAGVLPETASLVQVQNIMGVIYSSTSFMGMTSMMSVMPFMGMERVVFYREQASSMYSPWMFGLVSTLVDLPYLLVQVTLFVCIVYPMIHYIMTAQHFFFYYLITLESILFYSTFGCALVFITPSQQLAQVAGAGLNFLFSVMNGFVITYPNIPVYYQWFNRLSPTTWILYALGSDQLAGLSAPFKDSQVSNATTVGQYISESFDYTYGFRFWCIAIILAWIIFLRAMSVLGLRYMNFLKR